MRWRAKGAGGRVKFQREGPLFSAAEAAADIEKETGVPVSIRIRNEDYYLRYVDGDIQKSFPSLRAGKAAIFQQFLRYIIRKSDEFSAIVD